MKVSTKKIGSRLVRWFTRLTEHNKPRGRWYDTDNCGMG